MPGPGSGSPGGPSGSARTGGSGGDRPRTLRWARIALAAGALLLAAAVALFIWEATGDDAPPPTISGINR